MKTKFLFLAILVLVLFTGCGKAEEPVESQIISYQGATSGSDSSRYSNFARLPVATSEPDPDGVSFEGIGFAADNAYIMVEFIAPQSQSQLWQKDYIYVVDEETSGVYKDIPVMPIVGPLIGRPVDENRPGYVMLINYYQGIKSGSVVTVVIGNYKREHITVK